MLVRAYNNHNKERWLLTKWYPYSFFTREQAVDILSTELSKVDKRSITNIIKHLSDIWFLDVLQNENTNKANHVNFYLYTVPEKVEEENNIDLSVLDAWPSELVKKTVEVYTPSEGKFEWAPLDLCREFYDRIRLPWTKMEISDVEQVFPVDGKNRFFSICSHQCNTYFVWWVDVKLKNRCKDIDIVEKKYFWVDIDIRKNIQTLTWEVISDNQLYGYIDEILKLLDESDYWDYDEVVMSWNWVHIYYIWTPRKFDKEIYKIAVWRIYADINEIIAPLWLKCDWATRNIASLFRCPGTANYWRQEKYNLPFWQCFVYKRQYGEWITFDSLEGIAAQELSEAKEREINNRQTYEIVKAQPKKDDWNVFEKINSIPANSIFSAYTWLQLARDWKNFISNKDGKYIGCFYNKDKNIIVNSWTHYLGSNENSYNTFNYVMREVLWLTHCKESIKETIEYFKNNYNI